MACSGSRLGSTGDRFFGEAIELLELVDEDSSFLRASVHLIRELRLQHSDLAIDLLQSFLVGS